MKYLPCLILILLSNLTKGQLVTTEFREVDMFDDFTGTTDHWSQRENTRERFAIDQDRYILHRSSESFFSVSMPEPFVNYPSFEVSAKMQLLNDKEHEDAAAGLLFMGQETGTGAYAIEFNSQQKFRILILRNGAMRPLFPDTDDGWIYSRDLKKNRANIITIRCENTNYDIYINGNYQNSFTEPTYTSGGIGFYISPQSTLYVDYIKISTEEKQVKSSDPTDIQPSEITDETYSNLVKIFKDKIDAQTAEINQLQRELTMCKTNLNIDTTARKQNTMLTTENRELRDRVQQLETQLTKSQTQLEYLKSMKEDIEKSENGDLVLGLTDLLSKEKKKNNELQSRIEELETEIRELKSGN